MYSQASRFHPLACHNCICCGYQPHVELKNTQIPRQSLFTHDTVPTNWCALTRRAICNKLVCWAWKLNPTMHTNVLSMMPQPFVCVWGASVISQLHVEMVLCYMYMYLGMMWTKTIHSYVTDEEHPKPRTHSPTKESPAWIGGCIPIHMKVCLLATLYPANQI